MKLYLWLLAVGMLASLTACSTASLPKAELETQARLGDRQIVAHRGDRQANPPGWKTSEWDNSAQAIKSAINKAPRWIEIDIFLNRHPSAITSSTPYGILYVHHDSSCEQIDANGRGTGVWRKVETDAPTDVDKCAERLNNILNLRDASGRLLTNRWVIEMKPGQYNALLPDALYHLLTQRGQRTTEIVSSINTDMLIDLRQQAAAQGLTMNLMRVHWYLDDANRWDLDWSKQQGFKYVAVSSGNITWWDVAYAKDIGLKIGGWHWIDVSPANGNAWAANLDLDFMISDDINNMRSYAGWR
jgi:glycerophosphoryl diester phosphodiesterase